MSQMSIPVDPLPALSEKPCDWCREPTLKVRNIGPTDKGTMDRFVPCCEKCGVRLDSHERIDARQYEALAEHYKPNRGTYRRDTIAAKKARAEVQDAITGI